LYNKVESHGPSTKMNDNALILAEIRAKLLLGFYVHNLFDIAKLLWQLLPTINNPAACFMLRSIVLSIANDWDERPVPTTEAAKYNKEVIPIFLQILNFVENNSNDELLKSLNELVVTVIRVDATT
jgi:hypothetical protein